MRCRFEFRRYAVPFSAPVRTGRGVWTTREGVIVRLQAPDGRHGFGEAAPVPGFGGETAEDIAGRCRSMGATWTGAPGLLGLAGAAALGDIEAHEATPAAGAPHLAVAALLPAGRGAIAMARLRAEAGFRVFKWKVGVDNVADELGVLDDLCAELPGGSKMRLDANGAWDRRAAERWLERCADRPVEFVEQPCPAADRRDAADRESSRRDDLLLGLAADFPTPIALDESIAADTDVARWLDRGWRGLFVIKPSLHAAEALQFSLGAPDRVDRVVFSSALETVVGARSALRTAFMWPSNTRAVGFGVWPLFKDARFNGPTAAPFIRPGDLDRLDLEAAWTALA